MISALVAPLLHRMLLIVTSLSFVSAISYDLRIVKVDHEDLLLRKLVVRLVLSLIKSLVDMAEAPDVLTLPAFSDRVEGLILSGVFVNCGPQEMQIFFILQLLLVTVFY